MYTILGAGLSGLSVADHFQKNGNPFSIFEAKAHGGGHIYSENVGGFFWDEGPHLSFTKHPYVKEYFEKNCHGDFLEFEPSPVNYYHEHWIPHPAQTNMYAVPSPLREKCIIDVIETRQDRNDYIQPTDYREWLTYAFGKTFAETFSETYTRKYWTTEPGNLSTDWIGKRVYFPELSDMVNSVSGPLDKHTHYINKVRYPAGGGFYSYIKKIEDALPVQYNRKLKYISFQKKQLVFDDEEIIPYENLVNTLPLPQFIQNSDAPDNVKYAASKLKCSQLLLINVIADHPAVIKNHWIYVYDTDFYSTRINFTELLSESNGIKGKTGIQVEVYFSDYHPRTESIDHIAGKVLTELVTMGLIFSMESVISHHTKWVDWANVIFDKERIGYQDMVLNWLSEHGLIREADDLEPMTDWLAKPEQQLGSLILAGRFAQWKYYWTDDCVMRSKYICEHI